MALHLNTQGLVLLYLFNNMKDADGETKKQTSNPFRS